GPGEAPNTLPPDFIPFDPPTAMLATIENDLRNGPGRRFRSLRRLAASEQVAITGRAGDWLRVGEEGWVFGAYFQEPDAANAAGTTLAVITAVTAPVHAGPGGQYAIVAELYGGQQVIIDERRDDWAHVRNGGWVRNSALSSPVGGGSQP
ncbi:MAG: SH3 domain-containing protein, partial [Acidobacteriota bacterium]